ncbi:MULTISPECIES: hypothetical protein [Streptomyces]|uniref:hypothetical protein n=1 Tax=Streptomyces TaxID=1883 RepID=UPI00342F9226
MSARARQEQAPTAPGVHHARHLDEEHPRRRAAGRPALATFGAEFDPAEFVGPGARQGALRDYPSELCTT